MALVCHVCGCTDFSDNKVLWDALIAEWELSPDEIAYIDRHCPARGTSRTIGGSFRPRVRQDQSRSYRRDTADFDRLSPEPAGTSGRWTARPPRGDIDQHQVHRHLPSQSSESCGLPTRQRDLTAVPAHTRPLHRDRAAMEIRPPDRPSPAMASLLFRAAMVLITKPLGVILHHACKRGDAGREAETFEAVPGYQAASTIAVTSGLAVVIVFVMALKQRNCERKYALLQFDESTFR